MCENFLIQKPQIFTNNELESESQKWQRLIKLKIVETMETAGPSRGTCMSARLSGAELLVREVITRVDEFKRNAEKVDDAIKYLKQKVVAAKNCKQEFLTKIDIESSKELLYIGKKMQDLTSKSIAKLQFHADRMVQILSFLNKTDDSGRKMMEIEREATRKRWVKKTANRRSIIDEFKSKEKLAIPRANAETYVMDADPSEDEVSTRKTIEQSLHSHIAGTEVSHLIEKHINKHAEVLDSTFVKEENVHKQTTKFIRHTALSKIGSKREFLTLDRISRQKESCENEDTELTMRKNESISVASSKIQQSEGTTSVKTIEEFPFQKHDLMSIRKKTAVNRGNRFPDKACDFTGGSQGIKSARGNTASFFDGCMEKTPRKKISVKENDLGSCKSKILVLDKNFKVPEQNELSQIDNEREFSILDCTELSLPSPVLGSQRDSFKGKQKLMKGKYTNTAAQRWYSIADSQNSKERFVTQSKSRGQMVDMGQNRRPTAEIKLTEVDEMSEVCTSESEKATGDSNDKQKNKAARMMLKRRRNREITKSEEEESEVANDSSDDIYLHSSKGIYVSTRNACVSKERSRKSKKLSKNGVSNYFNRSESDSVMNENQGLLKNELDQAEQNIFGMCSDKLMKRENALPSVQGKVLQNRETRQCGRTMAEADVPMLLEENVSFNNCTGNTTATTVQQEGITESSKNNNHSQKIMEKPSFDESTDSAIIETVDFPDIYTSWHRILEQFIEIQSHNSTYLEHLEAVFEHVSDIYGILDMDNSEDQPRGLSEAQINCLPISQYSKQHDKNAERWGFKDTKCSICLSQYVYGELLRNLPCLHAFHVNCVDKWLERSNTCPTCRRVV